MLTPRIQEACIISELLGYKHRMKEKRVFEAEVHTRWKCHHGGALRKTARCVSLRELLD